MKTRHMTIGEIRDLTGVNIGYTLATTGALMAPETVTLRQVFCPEPNDHTNLYALPAQSTELLHQTAFLTVEALAKAYASEATRALKKQQPTGIGRLFKGSASLALPDEATLVKQLIDTLVTLPDTFQVANVYEPNTPLYSVSESGLFDKGILRVKEGKVVAQRLEQSYGHQADFILKTQVDKGFAPSPYSALSTNLEEGQVQAGGNNVRIFTDFGALEKFLTARVHEYEFEEHSGRVSTVTL